MDQLFVFDDTKWAINELEQSIQDFMFALVGSWNLRCDIDGLLQNEPNISAKELAARYTIGANVVGCDLKGVRSRFSWKDYKSSFSWILLNSTCAIFESWIDKLLGSNSVIPLQQANVARRHIQEIVKNDNCEDMRRAFLKSYQANPKYSETQLEVYLKCYSLFKEMRNAYMHVGRIVTQRCYSTYLDFSKSCTKESMGGETVPSISSLVRGTPIVLDYRGVIGFTNIVIRLLRTYDIMLLPTHKAKKAFIERANRLEDKIRDLSQLTVKRAKTKMCGVLAQIHIGKPDGMKAARKIFEDASVFKFGKAW